MKKFSRTSQDRIKKYRVVVNSTVYKTERKTSKGKTINRLSILAGGGLRAPLELSFKRHLEFSNWSDFLPFVDRTLWNPEKRLLDIQGGIWKLRVNSRLKIGPPKKNGKISATFPFTIIGGTLRGLEGRFFCEKVRKATTRCYLECDVADPEVGTIYELASETAIAAIMRKLKNRIEAEVGLL